MVAVDPALGFADSEVALTVSGSRLAGVHLVGYEGLGISKGQLEVSVTSTLTVTSVMVPGVQYPNVSSLDDGRLFGDPIVPLEVAQDHAIGYSADGMVRHYVPRPRLVLASPAVVGTAGGSLVRITGRGFTNTTRLACKFGPFWASSSKFINREIIECVSPALPVPPGESLPLSVSLNGEELASMADSAEGTLDVVVAEIPQLSAVAPQIAFFGEQDVAISIQGRGFLADGALSCRVGEVIVPGTLSVDSETGDQSVRWSNCPAPPRGPLVHQAESRSRPLTMASPFQRVASVSPS